MLTVSVLFAGAISGWIAYALIDMSSYYGIFGKLKFWIISKWMYEEDKMLIDSIDENEDYSAKEAEAMINDTVYWHVAKRSKVVYWLMCPYCMGVWIFTLITGIIWFNVGGDLSYLFCLWLFGIGLLYFFLNFANK